MEAWRIPQSCSEAIRSVRERLGSRRAAQGDAAKSDAAGEQRANFAPYAETRRSTGGRRGRSWSLKAVCLSGRNATRVPCTLAEREGLQAGLGEKEVVISDTDCSSEELRDILVSAFPKLGDCGGFEMLRCVPNSKHLEVISQSVSQSPILLKSVVGNGEVFIRPIQTDLKLDCNQKLSVKVIRELS